MIHAAIRNPYAVVAISLIVVILGVVSFQQMEVDVFPEINLPVVAVATFYKGMGPGELEGAITLRLEQLFLQASYVEHIESRSLPGVSLIKIYFSLRTMSTPRSLRLRASPTRRCVISLPGYFHPSL